MRKKDGVFCFLKETVSRVEEEGFFRVVSGFFDTIDQQEKTLKMSLKI